MARAGRVAATVSRRQVPGIHSSRRRQEPLFLKDIETGVERPVFDGLDHDLQEAWSMFGTYPQYAWMPDSKALVIWGGGRLWRVEAVDPRGPGRRTIPFTRTSSRR